MKVLKFTGIFIVLALFVLGVIAMSFYTGYQYAKLEVKPLIIWEVDEVREPVHHHDLIEVETPIFYPEYIEVMIEVPIEKKLRHFETRAELVRWLDSKPIIIISGGDCDDFAMALVEEANKDGFYMFFYPCHDAWHFKNCAIAGNNVYLIEPQNHEIELVMRVD